MIIARTCSKSGPTMVVPQGTAKWTSHPPALRAVDMKRKLEPGDELRKRSFTG